MATATIKKNSLIEAWVEEVRSITNPDAVVWCDGSENEWHQITDLLVKNGTFVPLKKKPNSFWCASDPSDVARVEDRTYICSKSEGITKDLEKSGCGCFLTCKWRLAHTNSNGTDFDKQGISVENTSKFMEQTMNDASRMGLNASKVVKNIQQNMKMLNR